MSVPARVTVPLRKRTSSCRTRTRLAVLPAIRADAGPKVAVPVDGARVANPEPIANPVPEG